MKGKWGSGALVCSFFFDSAARRRKEKARLLQSHSTFEDKEAEVGKYFLLMLNSYLLAYTTAASCSLILIQNFNSNPQTQTHEDLRPSPILTLTHTHFLAYSLILPLIMVISLQIVQQVMKKLCKQSIASCSELNLVNITKNSKKVPFFY